MVGKKIYLCYVCQEEKEKKDFCSQVIEDKRLNLVCRSCEKDMKEAGIDIEERKIKIKTVEWEEKEEKEKVIEYEEWELVFLCQEIVNG